MIYISMQTGRSLIMLHADDTFIFTSKRKNFQSFILINQKLPIFYFVANITERDFEIIFKAI